MSTMPAKMKDAMQEDWKLVESRQSVIDQVVEQALEPLSSTDGGPTILQALAHVFFHGDGDENILEYAESYADEVYAPHKVLQLHAARMREIAEALHGSTEEEERKKTHDSYFARVKFAILTVKLHLRSDAKLSAYENYFKRYDLAAGRDMYAEYLCDSGHLLDKNRKDLKKILDDFSILKMGNAMEGEMKKISKKKVEDTYMAEAMKYVEQLKKGEDDITAEMLLFLGALVEVPEHHFDDHPTLKNPVSLLQEKSKAIFDALEGLGGTRVGMQELRKDKAKFEMIMLATWWARYITVLFEFRQEPKDSISFLDVNSRKELLYPACGLGYTLRSLHCGLRLLKYTYENKK